MAYDKNMHKNNKFSVLCPDLIKNCPEKNIKNYPEENLPKIRKHQTRYNWKKKTPLINEEKQTGQLPFYCNEGEKVDFSNCQPGHHKSVPLAAGFLEQPAAHQGGGSREGYCDHCHDEVQPTHRLIVKNIDMMRSNQPTT